MWRSPWARTFRSISEWRESCSSMWSRKPMPVSTSYSPLPSRSSETKTLVSLVLRSTVAVRLSLSICMVRFPFEGPSKGPRSRQLLSGGGLAGQRKAPVPHPIYLKSLIRLNHKYLQDFNQYSGALLIQYFKYLRIPVRDKSQVIDSNCVGLLLLVAAAGRLTTS